MSTHEPMITEPRKSPDGISRSPRPGRSAVEGAAVNFLLDSTRSGVACRPLSDAERLDVEEDATDVSAAVEGGCCRSADSDGRRLRRRCMAMVKSKGVERG